MRSKPTSHQRNPVRIPTCWNNDDPPEKTNQRWFLQVDNVLGDSAPVKLNQGSSRACTLLAGVLAFHLVPCDFSIQAAADCWPSQLNIISVLITGWPMTWGESLFWALPMDSHGLTSRIKPAGLVPTAQFQYMKRTTCVQPNAFDSVLSGRVPITADGGESTKPHCS